MENFKEVVTNNKKAKPITKLEKFRELCCKMHEQENPNLGHRVFYSNDGKTSYGATLYMILSTTDADIHDNSFKGKCVDGQLNELSSTILSRIDYIIKDAKTQKCVKEIDINDWIKRAEAATTLNSSLKNNKELCFDYGSEQYYIKKRNIAYLRDFAKIVPLNGRAGMYEVGTGFNIVLDGDTYTHVACVYRNRNSINGEAIVIDMTAPMQQKNKRQ